MPLSELNGSIVPIYVDKCRPAESRTWIVVLLCNKSTFQGHVPYVMNNSGLWRKYMRLIGNILWFLLGGFVSGMAWVLSGAVWCITIIGIPYGLQCFKFAGLSFWPFGRRIEYGGGAVSFIVNVIWFLLNGWWMALGNLAIGCVWCITIIGIPFGIQFFKIAKLSLSPFGATIVRD